MKKFSPVVLFFIFIIGFWIWFHKVLKRERSLPISKDVICEIKRRVIEIDNIAKREKSYEDVMKTSKRAIFQLTFIGSPSAFYLIEALRDKKRHRFARVIYLQILAVIESKEAIPHIAETLKNDEDYLVRMQSAISLGMIKDKRAILALKDGLKDKEMVVRVASATALINVGRKDIVEDAIENDVRLKMYLEKWQKEPK